MKILFFAVFSLFMVLSEVHAQENYANAWPSITYYAKTTIKVAVIDERPYVVSGKKAASYLGAVRSLYGIPFDVSTAHGGPLAPDVETAIINGFANAGFNADRADSTSKFGKRAAQAGEILLLVTLQEWGTDTYMSSVGFSFKLTAGLYDHQGGLLGGATEEGNRTVKAALEGGRDALNQLLANPKIEAVITQKPNNMAVTPVLVSSEKDKADPKSRLLSLKALFDAGAITQEDYEQKKQEILKAL